VELDDIACAVFAGQADGLKTLYDVKTERDLKLTLYATMVFMLACVSVFYGTMLLNDYKVNQKELDLAIQLIRSLKGKF